MPSLRDFTFIVFIAVIISAFQAFVVLLTCTVCWLLSKAQVTAHKALQLILAPTGGSKQVYISIPFRAKNLLFYGFIIFIIVNITTYTTLPLIDCIPIFIIPFNRSRSSISIKIYFHVVVGISKK